MELLITGQKVDGSTYQYRIGIWLAGHWISVLPLINIRNDTYKIEVSDSEKSYRRH